MNNNYTPRSNAAIVYDCVENMHIADVARQLERELNDWKNRAENAERYANDMLQDTYEGAYVPTSLRDCLVQALTEVAPNHPVLKAKPPSYGVWEKLRKELDEANEKLDLVTKQRDDAWMVAEHRERNIKYENSLKQQLEESQKECLEQARLNGMGAEREAKLLSTLQSILDKIPCSYIPNHTIDRLPTIVEGLVEEVSYLSKEYDRLTDILEANGIEYPED